MDCAWLARPIVNPVSLMGFIDLTFNVNNAIQDTKF